MLTIMGVQNKSALIYCTLGPVITSDRELHVQYTSKSGLQKGAGIVLAFFASQLRLLSQMCSQHSRVGSLHL